MVRGFGYVSMLAALVLGGWLTLKAAQDTGPTSPAAQQAQDAASQVTASFYLQQANASMETWYSQYGTYAGASLPPAYGVTVVRADYGAYCLQAGDGANVQHLKGPGGNAPDPGPC